MPHVAVALIWSESKVGVSKRWEEKPQDVRKAVGVSLDILKDNNTTPPGVH